MSDTNTQLEDLLTALATLTEHNEQMLDKVQQAGLASAEQYTKQAELTNSVLMHFEQLQDKEKLLTDETLKRIQSAITTVFDKNEEQYHKRIDNAFTSHINKASLSLTTDMQRIKDAIKSLSQSAQQAEHDFKQRTDALSFFKDTYEAESDDLEQKVTKTLANVKNIASEQLEGLTDELTAKLTMRFGAILFSTAVMFVLFGLIMAWILIPSKDEIADRQAKYRAMNKAQLFDNIQKDDKGYYARIDLKDCYNTTGGWGKKQTYCKFD